MLIPDTVEETENINPEDTDNAEDIPDIVEPAIDELSDIENENEDSEMIDNE